MTNQAHTGSRSFLLQEEWLIFLWFAGIAMGTLAYAFGAN